MRRKFLIIMAVIMIASLIPTNVGFADSTPADCADGIWIVEAGQTLYFIAYTCGVTVDALVAYNNIENPNLIKIGQIIYIPAKDWKPGDPIPPRPDPDNPPEETPPPDGEPTEESPPPSGGSGDVGIEFGELLTRDRLTEESSGFGERRPRPGTHRSPSVVVQRPVPHHLEVLRGAPGVGARIVEGVCEADTLDR